MKNTAIKFVLIVFVCLGMTSCKFGLQGKGPVIEKEFPLNQDFHAVHITTGWEAELIKGDKPLVIAKTEENILDSFEIIIKDGVLTLKSVKTISYSKSRKLKIYYRELDQIQASSGAEIVSSETFEQKELYLSAYSGGEVKLHLKTESLSAAASSGGEIDLSGTSINIVASVSSGGEIEAHHLKSKEVTASASSGGSIKVQVLESLLATTSSGGDIAYYGNPENLVLNQGRSGGSIKQKFD